MTRTRPTHAVLLALLPLLLGSCRNPVADAAVAEALTAAGTEISQLQQDFSLMQNQLDSVRTVVARQDTIITRLAQMANLPISAH
ncbi:MAG: hypothetical protein JWO05_2708 [Gemmatimonadetes bacterium]|nr:hypothetical protein [Gemmatimonadota bacterium]